MDNYAIISIISFIVALAAGLAMVILYKKRIMEADVIHGASELLNNLPFETGSGVFATIAGYAKIAVQTVEQLVKTGQISRDDQSRRDAAMTIIENAAKVDEVPFGAAEQEAASACIEAEVQQLPRNQGKKPPADTDVVGGEQGTIDALFGEDEGTTESGGPVEA